MFDHFMGLLLLGLGIQSPMNPNVKGETTDSVERVELKDGVQNDLTREEKENYIREAKAKALRQREAYKASLRNTTEEYRVNREASRAAYAASLKDAREAFHDEVEARREEIKEEMQAKREAFEEKLKTIRDDKKRELAENIQDRLTELNTKRTDAMTRHLNRMNEILERILGKVDELKTAGTDTGVIEGAVTAADSAITTAQNAVAAQAGKSYIVTVTTEANLKSAVDSMRRQLEADLKATHAFVVAARKTVSTAIQELAKARGETVPDAIIK